MTVQDLINSGKFRTINVADATKKVDKVFCCDLLSIAMSKAPVGCAWVTVMANLNTLAIAYLSDVAVVVLAEGSDLDPAAVGKAKEQGINVLATEDAIFDTGLEINSNI